MELLAVIIAMCVRAIRHNNININIKINIATNPADIRISPWTLPAARRGLALHDDDDYHNDQCALHMQSAHSVGSNNSAEAD